METRADSGVGVVPSGVEWIFARQDPAPTSRLELVQPILAGPPTEPHLTDGVVTLRPWRRADAAAVFAACQDPEIGRWTNVPQPYEFHHAEGFIAMAQTAWRRGTAAGFAITDAQTDQLLGSMSREPFEGHIASFGYWLAPEARGRGTATRALRLIADWTLATTDAIRLESYTDVGNDASARVLERAGFAREGVRRSWDTDRAGRPIDSVFYVRVREAEAAGDAAAAEIRTTNSVRPAQPGDYEAVAALNREVQQLHADRYPTLFKLPSGQTLPQATFDAWVSDPNGLMLAAVEDGRVVGYVQGELVSRDETPYRGALRLLYVNQICVTRACGRRGHGHRLIEMAAEHARRTGITRLELDTWALNTEARDFFENEGFLDINIRMARGLSEN